MWKPFLREWLRFSHKEQTGIVILVVLMIITIYIPEMLFYFRREPDVPANDLAAAVRAFEATAVAPVKHAFFYFNPNTITAQEWQQLGVSARTAESIEKYIAKGGRFRRAADLEKIYGLTPELCKTLQPWVRINDPVSSNGYGRWERDVGSNNREYGRGFSYKRRGYTGEKQSGSGGTWESRGVKDRWERERRVYGLWKANPEKGSESAASLPYHRDSVRSYVPGVAYRKKTGVVIDINAADSMLWQQLPGIGPGLARRIITFRGRLGGFYSAEQIGECYGLPDSVFQKIQPFLKIGDSSLKKMDLNLTDEKSLAAHPYIRYKLARLIVQYRSSHAGFREIKELRMLPLVDEIIYRKIEHYMEIKH
jgi:DNA uptake protein ComE-like DNA-binding protein